MSAANGLEVKADPTTGLDDGKQIAHLLRKEHAKAIETAFLGAADLGVSFDLENEHVQTVLKKLAKNVRGVAESTKEEIRGLVGKAAELGWSNAELAEQIIAHGVTASKSRATTIARSETAAAFSQGSLAAWRESGVVDRKEWLATGDSCEICQSLAGKVVGIDDDFADGIDAPPMHPRCVCAVSPVLAE